MDYKSDKKEDNTEYFKIDKGRVRANLVSELWVGGGDTSFRANREGVFAGANNYTNAPFKIGYDGSLSATGTITASNGTGTEVWLNSATGAVEFYYNSLLTGNILALASGEMSLWSKENMYLGTDNGQVLRLLNDDSGDFIKGSVILSRTGSSIGWLSGRRIYDASSGIGCSGDFRPSGDYGNDLGTTTKRWNNIRAKMFYASDYFQGGHKSSDGSAGITKSQHKFITDIWQDGSELKCKERFIEVEDGLITYESEEDTRTIN